MSLRHPTSKSPLRSLYLSLTIWLLLGQKYNGTAVFKRGATRWTISWTKSKFKIINLKWRPTTKNQSFIKDNSSWTNCETLPVPRTKTQTQANTRNPLVTAPCSRPTYTNERPLTQTNHPGALSHPTNYLKKMEAHRRTHWRINFSQIMNFNRSTIAASSRITKLSSRQGPTVGSWGWSHMQRALLRLCNLKTLNNSKMRVMENPLNIITLPMQVWRNTSLELCKPKTIRKQDTPTNSFANWFLLSHPWSKIQRAQRSLLKPRRILALSLSTREFQNPALRDWFLRAITTKRRKLRWINQTRNLSTQPLWNMSLSRPRVFITSSIRLLRSNPTQSSTKK